MTRPRVSISGLILLITLAAANCAVFRLIVRAPAFELFLGLSPILNLLLIGLVLLSRQLVSEGKGSSFWLGVEVFGWASVLAYVADWAGGIPLLLIYYQVLFDGLCGALGRDLKSSPSLTWVEPALLAIFVSLPQVLFAVFGGWLARRMGLALVLVRPSGAGVPA